MIFDHIFASLHQKIILKFDFRATCHSQFIFFKNQMKYFSSEAAKRQGIHYLEMTAAKKSNFFQSIAWGSISLQVAAHVLDTALLHLQDFC